MLIHYNDSGRGGEKNQETVLLSVVEEKARGETELPFGLCQYEERGWGGGVGAGAPVG